MSKFKKMKKRKVCFQFIWNILYKYEWLNIFLVFKVLRWHKSTNLMENFSQSAAFSNLFSNAHFKNVRFDDKLITSVFVISSFCTNMSIFFKISFWVSCSLVHFRSYSCPFLSISSVLNWLYHIWTYEWHICVWSTSIFPFFYVLFYHAHQGRCCKSYLHICYISNFPWRNPKPSNLSYIKTQISHRNRSWLFHWMNDFPRENRWKPSKLRERFT